MGVHPFDQNIEVVKQMWSEVFEAGITTNAYLSEMWTTNDEVEEDGTVCGDSRGREIEFALRYFDEKYRPLRMLMEKPSSSKLIEVEGQDMTYTEQAASTTTMMANTIAAATSTNSNNNNNNYDYNCSCNCNSVNIDATTTSERKPSTCDSFNYLQLDLPADPASAALTFDTSHRDRPKCEETDFKEELDEEEEEEEIEENYHHHHQQQQPQQHREHSVASHGEYPMADQRFNIPVLQQENPERHFLAETKCNMWDTTPSQNDEKYEVDLDMAESGIASNGELMEGETCRKDLDLDGDPLNILRSELGSQIGKSRMVCRPSSGSRDRNRTKLKRNMDVPETKQQLEVSLDNLRKHLCVSPTSSFEVLHSCPNNFEKLKYLRIKERESPMVRLSCAFQQGYYLELLFPGRKIHTTTSTAAEATTTNNNTNSNYLQRLFDLNMSLSYSRQLRQFYKNFRRYRRLLHLNVPLRSILRNISRIREKIESSEREEQFWSTLPTTTMRAFYECYGKWFGLALCDVYSLFDVVDNYPSDTAEQFLDNKCVRLYECEGHMKAVKWLNCLADKPRYLLVYKTMDYVHCLLAEKKGDRWTYELSFDRDKDSMIHVGIYVCIKSH